MKRTAFGFLAVLLAMGGCPAVQPDPQPGVVNVLTAGDYGGDLSCATVDGDGVQVRTGSMEGKVLVTDATQLSGDTAKTITTTGTGNVTR